MIWSTPTGNPILHRKDAEQAFAPDKDMDACGCDGQHGRCGSGCAILERANRGVRMGSIRRPAVAGFSYPGDAATFRAEIAELLAGADPPSEAVPPKAILVPHAGHVYSGAVATPAYDTTGPATGKAHG